MTRKKRLKLCLAAILLLMTVLIGYKLYLLSHETDYQALNADNIDRIAARLRGKDVFTFAVLGNIRNSMRIFEKRIAPLIRGSGADFMVSVGNAVADGAEDKYRLLYRGLKDLGIPYLLAPGPNEVENFGAGKFYRHFGPYFFSFRLENADFIFLDSTGLTSWKWQLRWLRRELKLAAGYTHRFVFLYSSLFPLAGFHGHDNDHVLDKQRARTLRRLFTKYRVTAVFSAGYPTYHQSVVDGVRYVVSGGGGGLLLDRKTQYQFVKVRVGPHGVSCENVNLPHHMGTFSEKLETLKLFLHSFFYMSFINSLLILAVIGLVALKIYSLIIRQENLYRDFSVVEADLAHSPLRVAMFTNNYLPFLGGVPLSIDRLYRGLLQLGEKVMLFAPTYPLPWDDPQDQSIFRCPTLFHSRIDNFPIANTFSRKVEAAFKAFDSDLVHVHHPFWLGKKGLHLAKRKNIPVVFTYHTRLERYTHYIPLPGSALKNLVAHFLIKHFANRCDAIITPTVSTEEYLRNLGVSALIETIPTGIRIDDYRHWSREQVRDLKERYISPGERLLISVSRMAQEKNLDFLIDGLAKVKTRSRTSFRCLLIGDGPEKRRLVEKVARLGMSDRIVFSGNMAPYDVIGRYLAADLFVFASTSETQGMVLLEAMAGACPVVAVRASGVYDVVKDGFNGFKVAESTDDWAETVAGLLDDDQRLIDMSRNSLAFAGDYSEKKMSAKVSRLYRRVTILHRSEKR